MLVVWYTGRCWWSLSKRDRCWWYGILGGVGGLCLRETGVGGMVYWEVLVSLSKRDRCWWYGILGGVGGLCLRETGVGGMVYWEVLVVSV